MTDEATFDACMAAITALTPYGEASVTAALRDLAEEFPDRCWDPVELVDMVQYWIARECVRQNLASGYFRLIDYDPNGEARYRVTEAGVRRIEAMLRGGPDGR